MPHCTPEQLALAALREPLPAGDAQHLAGCARCRREVAALRRGVDALAVPQLAAQPRPVPPPPAVWEAIAARTGVTARPRPEIVASPLLPAPEPMAAPGGRACASAAAAPAARRVRSRAAQVSAIR